MKKTLLWIVIGAAIGLAAQFGVERFSEYRNQKSPSSFLNDLQAAPDKSEAIKNYLSSEKGLSVGVSKSDARLRVARSCSDILEQLDGLDSMRNDLFDLFDSGRINTEGLYDGLDQLWKEQDRLYSEWVRDCRDGKVGDRPHTDDELE